MASKKSATFVKMSASVAALLNVPSFNYPSTTWAAKRAYAHFGNEAYGVNG